MTSGPDPTDLLPPFVAVISPPLGLLLAGAWRLFGGHHDSSQHRPGGGGDRHVDDATQLPQLGTFVGATSAAEAAAKQVLAAQTETLNDLDHQLDDLSKKITDQNDASRRKLLDIKSDVDKELDYVNTSDDHDVQKSAALSQFLSEKAAAIAKVITDAVAEVSANQQQLQHLNVQYGQRQDPNRPTTQDPTYTGDPGGPADTFADPGGVAPSLYGPSAGDPYGGGGEGYGDDMGSELGQMLPLIASALPGAFGGLNPMSSLGGLGDLGGVLGDAIHSGNGHNSGDDSEDLADKKDKSGAAVVAGNKKVDQAGQQENDQSGQASGQDSQKPQQQSVATPITTPPPAPPAPSLVKRIDGSSATAVSPAVASAASAHLGGASIEDAYKAAGITLPPPGTQVKDTLPSLSMAQVGDLAVFKDKYVMLLGDNKVYLDGQEQPVSALAKLTGFVGFCHPPASSTPNVPAPASPAEAAPSAPV
jgi:hypothetical protein